MKSRFSTLLLIKSHGNICQANYKDLLYCSKKFKQRSEHDVINDLFCCRWMLAISPAKKSCSSCGGGVVEKVIQRHLNMFGDYSGHGIIGIP